jgi:DNA polymerase II large subunit
VAALERLTLLAHGGTAGAVIEVALVLAIVLVFAAVYLRERRGRRPRDGEGQG